MVLLTETIEIESDVPLSGLNVAWDTRQQYRSKRVAPFVSTIGARAYGVVNYSTIAFREFVRNGMGGIALSNSTGLIEFSS
jgi:hypothetical protein